MKFSRSMFRFHPFYRPVRPIMLCLLVVGVVGLVGPVFSEMEMTDTEYALLPEYCHYKDWVSLNHRNHPRSEKWEDYFGKDFLPIHHYCWALVRFRRVAYRTNVSKSERDFWLKEADGNINYVLTNTSQRFPLRAELITKQMEMRILRRDEQGTEEAFRSVVSHDPKYVNAYWLRGFWLHRRGRDADAIRVLEAGLEKVPDAKKLMSLRDEIRAAKVGEGKRGK